ncbi:MAG: TadG family pilus assembly protein [Pseudomonadota bacterium]
MLGRGERTARRFREDLSGSVSIMFAGYVFVGVLCLALAIDLQMLYTQRRAAQGAADLAAIVAANNIGDEEEAAESILAGNGYDFGASVETGLLKEAEAQSKDSDWFTAIAGRYVADDSIPRENRFTPGGTPENAVAVTLGGPGRLFFADNFVDAPQITVDAIAARRALAGFSVGSRLVSVNGGVLNALLSSLLGAEVNLSVLDYNNLLNSKVEVFSFLDALATELNIVSGDYQSVLDSEPTLSQVISAAATASSDRTVGNALFALENAAGSLTDKIDLAGVIDLGAMGDIVLGAAEEQGFPLEASMMQMLLANAVAANGENLLNLDLGTTIPGVASLTAQLRLGEMLQTSPWFRVGEGGEIVANTQIQLAVEASVGGTGVLSGVNVRLPTYFEVARAQAQLESVSCPSGNEDDATVMLAARSAALDAYIGDVDLSKRSLSGYKVKKAKIVAAPGLVAFAEAEAAIAQSNDEILEFTHDDIVNGTVKTAGVTSPVESIVGSLVEDVAIEARVLGLGLSTEGLANAALLSALGSLAGPVDTVVTSLLEALGVGVGEGDYQVNGVECRRAVLVE